jgi:hypothetical protein
MKTLRPFTANDIEVICEFLKRKHAENPNVDCRIDPVAEAWQIMGDGEESYPARYPAETPDQAWGYVADYFGFPMRTVKKFGRTGQTRNGTASIGLDYDGKSHGDTGCSVERLEEIKRAAIDAGLHVANSPTDGLHIKYKFTKPVPTNNRRQHGALAGVVLEDICNRTGFDFKDGLDVAGGVLWDWKEGMRPDGKFVWSQGELHAPPTDWESRIVATDSQSTFSISDSIELDTEHRRLLNWLQSNGGCQQVHTGGQDGFRVATMDLAKAHKALGIRGKFSTNSDSGKANAVMFPRLFGAWYIVRLGGHRETDDWQANDNGNYCITFNPQQTELFDWSYQYDSSV